MSGAPVVVAAAGVFVAGLLVVAFGGVVFDVAGGSDLFDEGVFEVTPSPPASVLPFFSAVPTGGGAAGMVFGGASLVVEESVEEGGAAVVEEATEGV